MSIAHQIYALHEKLADNTPRPHLGASEIGEPCNRKLWYKFRWAFASQFGGRMLRLLETGHLSEARIIKELRLIGYEVVDREDGHQLRFSEFGGHFAGSIDGKIKINNEWYLLEIKTTNKKQYQKLIKDGLRATKPLHYAQIQTYLYKLKLEKALYIAICKDDEEIYTEIVSLKKKEADALELKALEIIKSDNVPLRLNNQVVGDCKYCDFAKNCHRLDSSLLPEFNCRTCIHSTASMNGKWDCVKGKKEIEQQKGCSEHLFIPELVPGQSWAFQDRIEYKTIEGKTIINRVGKGLEVLK